MTEEVVGVANWKSEYVAKRLGAGANCGVCHRSGCCRMN